MTMNKLALYHRLAVSNLRRNGQLYLPYGIMGMGLVAMFYIVLFLAGDEKLTQIRGAAYLPFIMQLGTIVVGILSVIMLLYTNSFLMKRRKTEFGLYNILGMEKRHIARVMLVECLYAAAASIVLGLVLGVGLYKLLVLLMLRLMGENAVFGFYLSQRCIVMTAALFGGIYVLGYFYDLIQVARSKPIELLHSSHTGEREPKIKWIMTIVGVAALAGGYYISITTESPLKAIELFFIAVLLVILGTYCLFTAGSIALLKLLKGNKRYYYQPRHMTAVSGLLYRMKQNAAGLASICILSTMVLVMISTTVCLYIGIEDSINLTYPYDLTLSAAAGNVGEEDEAFSVEMQDAIFDVIQETAEEKGVPLALLEKLDYLNIGALFQDGEFCTDISTVEDYASSDLWSLYFITREEYEDFTGTSLDLKENEIALYRLATSSSALPESFRLMGEDYQVKTQLNYYPVPANNGDQMFNCAGVVLSSQAELDRVYEQQQADYGANASGMAHCVVVNYGGAEEEQIRELEREIQDRVHKAASDKAEEMTDGGYGSSSASKQEAWDYDFAMVGSLFFLGLVLGAVFLMATVLIIYYKQVSEGYEDRERFQIMQKVGMSKAEVGQSIRSQILMVFFLPLGMAVLHLAAAYPLLVRLLRIFAISSNMLFVACCCVCVLVFAAAYTVVYGITAKVYDKIVS